MSYLNVCDQCACKVSNIMSYLNVCDQCACKVSNIRGGQYGPVVKANSTYADDLDSTPGADRGQQ